MSFFSRNMDPEDLAAMARVTIFKRSGEDQFQPIAEFHSNLDPDEIVSRANNILDKKLHNWRKEKHLFSIKVIPPADLE